MDAAVTRSEDDLQLVVAVQVDERAAGYRLERAGQGLRPAGVLVRVPRMHPDTHAVLAGVPQAVGYPQPERVEPGRKPAGVPGSTEVVDQVRRGERGIRRLTGAGRNRAEAGRLDARAGLQHPVVGRRPAGVGIELDIDDAVYLLVPVGGVNVGLRRHCARPHAVHGALGVDAAVARPAVPSGKVWVGAGGIVRFYDVVRRAVDDLADLLRGDVLEGQRAGVEYAAIDQVPGPGEDERGDAAGVRHRGGGAAGVAVAGYAAAGRRSIRGRHHIQVRAVVREVGFAQIGRDKRRLVVRDDGADSHDIVENGLEVLVKAEFVGRGVNGKHVLARGVIERRPRHRGGARGTQRHHDHLVPLIGSPYSADPGVFRSCDERAVHADIGQRASRADTGNALAVVGLCGNEAVAAGAMAFAVRHVLVVVCVPGVPAGDIVDEAVVVGVDTVFKDAEVTTREESRVDGVGDPGITGIVEDVEDSVVIAVVWVRRRWKAGRAVGDRQLASVQPDLVPQVLVVVIDAGIKDDSHDVRTAGGNLPGQVRGDAACLAGVRRVVRPETEEVPLAGW